MRIVCPSCAATYDVPDALLAAGRAVRCAKCGEKWLPSAEPEPQPQPTEGVEVRRAGSAREFESRRPVQRDAAPIEGAFTRLTEGPLPRLTPQVPVGGRLLWPLSGWLATVAILVSLGWAGVAWRTEVMRQWPPSERLYAALGLAR